MNAFTADDDIDLPKLQILNIQFKDALKKAEFSYSDIQKLIELLLSRLPAIKKIKLGIGEFSQSEVEEAAR